MGVLREFRGVCGRPRPGIIILFLQRNVDKSFCHQTCNDAEKSDVSPLRNLPLFVRQSKYVDTGVFTQEKMREMPVSSREIFGITQELFGKLGSASHSSRGMGVELELVARELPQEIADNRAFVHRIHERADDEEAAVRSAMIKALQAVNLAVGGGCFLRMSCRLFTTLGGII